MSLITAPLPHDPTPASYVPGDPLRSTQWHLDYMNLPAVWADYTGAGVKVMIIDDGFELNHTDLVDQFGLDLSYDYLDNDNLPQAVLGNSHGTAIAGIIAAANNNAGGVGVAFDATLIGARIGFGGAYALEDFDNAFFAMRQADIVNNSWGYTTAYSDNFFNNNLGSMPMSMLQASLLGTSIVFSAGNLGASGDNTNYHNFLNSPYVITVSAFEQDGDILEYATPGANILVSAPGRGLITTDGLANAGYANTDYVTVEGTSFAAPNVSGVIALMKEANPGLSYSDIQNILVLTSRQIGPDAGWQTNGAGLHYSHSYGFGAVDAHAAVRMAETWENPLNSENLALAHGIESIYPQGRAIPDQGFLYSTVNISDDIAVEHVRIRIELEHADISQLEITLVSPDGTRSLLADNGVYPGTSLSWNYYSVAHWGEQSAGTWTLEVRDTAAGSTGQMAWWVIEATGRALTSDTTFTYINEFKGAFASSDADGGIDTINAAARTENISLSLGATIENIFTGDGNDYITGNAGTNRILTGRGNDTIIATSGNDDIDGGRGTDTYFSYNPFAHAVTDTGDGNFTLTYDGYTVTLTGIEIFNFAGLTYTAADLLRLSQATDPVDVVYAVHGDAGISIRTSEDSGFTAYTAEELDIGGSGVVLLEERAFDHLTLTNSGGQSLDALSMRMDDGLALTARGFNEINLVADGKSGTSIDTSAQRGFIQTGAGNDTIDFTGFLIEASSPAQDRALSISTQGGNDTVLIDDRSHYMTYDIDMGAGADYFFAENTLGGSLTGGSGADTFAFGLNNGPTMIEDFSSLENDRLDLSDLLDHHNPNDALANFIALTTQGNDTLVSVDGTQIATLKNVTLADPVQSYIDNGLLIVD